MARQISWCVKGDGKESCGDWRWAVMAGFTLWNTVKWAMDDGRGSSLVFPSWLINL